MSHRIQVQGYTKKGVTVEKDDLDGQALAAFLRRKYRHCAAGYVAAKTGIPEATVKGWLMLRARPCSAHLLALVSAYGLALLSACWRDAPDEIVAHAKKGEMQALHAEIAALQAQL